MRRDPGYIARMHMRVLDGSGREIDPRVGRLAFRRRAELHGAAGFRHRQRARRGAHRHAEPAFGLHARHQPPGILRRRLSLPVVGLRARRESARPRGLAAAGQSGWSRAKIDAAIATAQRQDIRLTRKVPVAWIYLTGWVSARQRRSTSATTSTTTTTRRRASLVAELRSPAQRRARLRLRAAVRRSPHRSGRSRISTASRRRGCHGCSDGGDRSCGRRWRSGARRSPTTSSAELATGGLIFVRNDNVEMRSEELTHLGRAGHRPLPLLQQVGQADVTVLVAFPMPEIKVSGRTRTSRCRPRTRSTSSPSPPSSTASRSDRGRAARVRRRRRPHAVAALARHPAGAASAGHQRGARPAAEGQVGRADPARRSPRSRNTTPARA